MGVKEKLGNLYYKYKIQPAIDKNGIEWVRQRLYDNLNPVGYWEPVKRINSALDGNMYSETPEQQLETGRKRDDIFAEYLNIPQSQRHNVSEYIVQNSDYVPTKQANQNSIYKKIPLTDEDRSKLVHDAFNETFDLHRDNPHGFYKRVEKGPLQIGELKVSSALSTLLGPHTVSRGFDNNGDYISYYDYWDIAPISGKGNGDETKGIGKPVEFYDRIYLDDYYDIPEEARGNPFIAPSVVTAYKKGGRIHIKKKNRGSFTEYCGGKVTEECIAKGKNSKNPKIRKKATFAANARKWKHENGGILKVQEGTGNLYTPHPLSPVGIALNQARAMAKGKKDQQHLPPGVKEVVGPDGKKVAIRTEQPLQPLEQSIAEWLPGTGDVAEVGYIADDIKNGRYGSAVLGAGLLIVPGNAGKLIGKHKFAKIQKLDRDIPKGRKPQKVSKKVDLDIDELSDANIYINGTEPSTKALERKELAEDALWVQENYPEEFRNFFQLKDIKDENSPFGYLVPKDIEHSFKNISDLKDDFYSQQIKTYNDKPYIYRTKKGKYYSLSPKIGNKTFDLLQSEWGNLTPITKNGLRIFDQYKNAMNRRRDYTWKGLAKKYDSGFAYGIEDSAGNALIGYPLFGKGFVASHFAPKTLRGGMNLISNLNKSKYPVMFSVTDDLSPMLSKLGYIKLRGNTSQLFDNKIAQKDLFINQGFDPGAFAEQFGFKDRSTMESFLQAGMTGSSESLNEMLNPIILQ